MPSPPTSRQRAFENALQKAANPGAGRADAPADQQESVVKTVG
jgi:hypothetical protein